MDSLTWEYPVELRVHLGKRETLALVLRVTGPEKFMAMSILSINAIVASHSINRTWTIFLTDSVDTPVKANNPFTSHKSVRNIFRASGLIVLPYHDPHKGRRDRLAKKERVRFNSQHSTISGIVNGGDLHHGAEHAGNIKCVWGR
jgi:hypothetical protein